MYQVDGSNETSRNRRKMYMATQEMASLFGPECLSFEKAQDWGKDLKVGDSFKPTHGAIAGYHVEPGEETPIQNFDPPLIEGRRVVVTKIHKTGNISVKRSDGEAKLFYPHVVVDVEYEELVSP